MKHKKEENNDMKNDKTIPRMLTIRQAARELSFPEHALRVLVREGKVVHVRTGTKVLVNLDRLIEYLSTGETVSKERNGDA